MMFDDDDIVFDDAEDIVPETAKLQIPTWMYMLLFFAPSTVTLVYLYSGTGLDTTTSAIIALAVMNGSINGVIAWLTIRLDGHSTDALEHLDAIINEMDNLTEAKNMFQQIGIDLGKIDIDSVSDVISRIKENRGDINIMLDNLKEVDVTKHLDQARRIDWQMLMDSAEEIMSFIRASKESASPTITKVVLPTLTQPPNHSPIIEDDDGEFFESETSSINLEPPKRARTLDLRPPRRRR
jgi:hypothetical protein